MYNPDPRFLMAETYTLLKNEADLEEAFNAELSKVESPEEAIKVCLKYTRLSEELNA